MVIYAEYRKWSRLVGAQILINEFQAAISGPLEILINGGENQSVWGTYVHPDLIVHTKISTQYEETNQVI